MSQATAGSQRFVTDIPARLDRLPWSSRHWRIVVAPGITWVLDGLEVSEILPMEIRAMAIAAVYTVGTLVGGGVAPTLFGALIQRVFLGYLFGFGAGRKALEDSATPLTAVAVQRAA